MLAPEELAISGYYRGHEVAKEIASIARSLPDLAVEIYERLYTYREMSMELVPMGTSAVMPMQISRHDMYGGAYHELQQGLPRIFEVSPRTATRAVCAAVHHKYVRSVSMRRTPVNFEFNGVHVQTTDLLGTFRGLDGPHDDESRLLIAWSECLRKLPTIQNGIALWQAVADTVIEEPRPAQIWAVILSVVPEHPTFYKRRDLAGFLFSKDLLPCWRNKRTRLDPCIKALAVVTGEMLLSQWQDIVSVTLVPEDPGSAGLSQ